MIYLNLVPARYCERKRPKLAATALVLPPAQVVSSENLDVKMTRMLSLRRLTQRSQVLRVRRAHQIIFNRWRAELYTIESWIVRAVKCSHPTS